ncbi:MAG: mandelate racemase/muconate lactonizing enzyme family protein [Negativicutes bacterium]|nr:mandelate racemase/muconate lactonizing enzyme family protein [Negativicutes bacterium]
MKITSVDVFQVTTGKPPLKGDYWKPVVVRVNTDEGISGFGEVGLAYAIGAEAGFAMSVEFARLIIGRDPMNNEQIWDKLHKKTFWGQGGGTVIFGGISGLDIALWDIKGKALGVPAYKLLGGKTQRKLRTYASQLQFGWGKTARVLIKPEEYAEAALDAVNDGYDCIKVDPIAFDLTGKWARWNLNGVLSGVQVKTAYARLKAMREAIGPDKDIICELHAYTDATAAIQLGRAIEDLDIFCLEEPVMPMNPEMMKMVAENVKIPLASGERIYTRWGYRPFFENHSLRVIQPDLGLVGGLTEGKKIADYAHLYDVTVQAHVCGGPIATAAALQLEAAIPNFIIHEHHQAAMLKENIAIGKYDYQPVKGYFDIPELPGIGQEMSEEAMKAAICVTVK